MDGSVPNRFKTIYMVTLLLLPSFVCAENMSDPMRPPQSGAGVAPRNAGDPRWQVTGILISAGRKLAMINDRLIGVGEKVDGARVRSIHGNSVELDIDGQLVVLRPVAASLRQNE
jgi:hypothetical protein